MSNLPADAALGLFQHSPRAIHVYRPDDPAEPRALRLLAVNPASERIFGESAAGALLGEVFPSLLRAGVAEVCERALQTGEPAELAGVHLKVADGRAAWMMVLAFPLDGDKVGVEFHDASSADAALDLRIEAMTQAFEHLPDIVFIKDAELRYVMSNKAGADILGQTPASMVGKRMRDVFPEKAAATLAANDRQIFADRRPVSLEEPIPVHGLGVRTYASTKTPFYKEDGTPHFLVGISQDITERRRAEEALQKNREEFREIRANLLETIRELSTPVLPIRDGVLVVPLIGHMDTQRSAQFTDALLHGIQRHRAEAVIIDVTGVDYIDNAVANHLLVAIRAAALLGTECVVVGISPTVSRTLTQIGFDFSAVVTRRDLQAGVAYAVDRLAQLEDEEEDEDVDQESEGDAD